MTAPFDEEDLRRQAVRRAKAKLGFRGHLITFVVVNLGLAALNLATSRLSLVRLAAVRLGHRPGRPRLSSSPESHWGCVGG